MKPLRFAIRWQCGLRFRSGPTRFHRAAPRWDFSSAFFLMTKCTSTIGCPPGHSPRKRTALNVVDEGGYRTGEHWNSTWLYPEIFKPERLIVMKSRGVTLLPGQKRKAAYLAPLTVIRAEAQIDAASDIAQTILSSEPATIPKQCMLYEAVHVLHASSLNLSMRLDHARDIVHAWANELDSKTAGEVREHLQQWVQRSLTVEAARWIKRGSKGEPPEHFWW